jgi:hypothetical protein
MKWRHEITDSPVAAAPVAFLSEVKAAMALRLMSPVLPLPISSFSLGIKCGFCEEQGQTS